MEAFEWSFNTTNGLDLFARGWAPKGRPKGVLALVHGLGEHCGRYAHVGAALADKGYALLGFDLRGHGKSGGQRGHTPTYDTLLNDITVFLQQVEERYPDLPRFLYGHSLGGSVVLNYALKRKPDLHGVIATAAWLKLAFTPPAAKVMLGKLMNNIAPGFTQANGLDTTALSRDSEVVSNYVNDPLVHNKISARMFIGIYENGLWALEHAAEFPLPLLLMHGTNDQIISVEGSKEFAAKMGSKATLKLFNGLYHEIHNEPEKAEVFKEMVDWLSKH